MTKFHSHRYLSLASNAHKYLPIIMYCLGQSYKIINMPLHDPSWYLTCVQRFSPVPLTVFELQGLKLKNNNNNNNNKNCKK